jgi:hypothetical protein
MRQKTSITLTPEALRLIELLMSKLGINKGSVIETAIRELAKKEKVK